MDDNSTQASGRRGFISKTGVGAAGIVALAGCIGDVDTEGGGNGDGNGNGGGNGNGNGDDSFPSDNVTMIVPVGEGGGLDTSLRTLQPYWEEALGTNLEFDYHPGAGTLIGLQHTINQPADGYTVVGNATPDAYFLDQMEGDDFDIDQISMVGSYVNDNAIIRIREDEDRFSTLPELVDYARDNPRELTFGLSAVNNNLLSMLLIEEATGAEFQPVLYDGGGDARLSLSQGETDFINTSIYASLGISDDTNVIAVHGEENLWPDLTDDAPTINDALGTDIPDAPGARRYIIAVNSDVEADHPGRLQTLRETFTDAMENPAYLDDLADRDPPEDDKIDHLTGEELEAESAELEQLASEYYDQMEAYLER